MRILEIYVLVRTLTYAQMVVRMFGQEGFSCRQVKSPREIGKGGCGYAVVLKNASPETVAAVTRRSGLPNFRIFITRDGKNFEKIG